MSRKEFMRKLKSALLWSYSPDEVQDILSDYEEFFSVGLSEGKTEEQLAAQFGDPKAIALDLKLQLKTELMMKHLSSKVILRILIAITLLLITAVFLMSMAYNPNIVRDSSMGVIIFNIALWFIMGGGIKSIPPIKYQKEPGKYDPMKALHIIPPIIVLTVYMFFMKLPQINFPIFGIPLDRIGAWVSFIGYVLVILITFIFIYSLYGFYRFTPKYFALTCHTIACLGFVFCVNNMLHMLNDIAILPVKTTLCLLPYIIGVMSVFVVRVYISFLYQRGKK